MPITTHESPVWRARANFIVMADLSGNGLRESYEQLWARQIEDTTFMVCCIPFFTYGISLGDVVLIDRQHSDGNYLIKSVIKRTGRHVLRVWVYESAREKLQEKIFEVLTKAACLYEISANGLIAIDVEKHDQLFGLEKSLSPLINNKTSFLEHG